MVDLEIPLGKRTRLYRFLEMLPAIISYGAIITLVVLSLVNPLLAAIYLLLIILTMLVKVVGITTHMIVGRSRMDQASQVDWRSRLEDLEDPHAAYSRLYGSTSTHIGHEQHLENLRLMSASEPGFFPKPSQIYNVVIMPAYNEPLEVIQPAVQAVLDTTYDKKHLIVIFAYEERGGAGIKKTAETLKKRYQSKYDYKMR